MCGLVGKSALHLCRDFECTSHDRAPIVAVRYWSGMESPALTEHHSMCQLLLCFTLMRAKPLLAQLMKKLGTTATACSSMLANGRINSLGRSITTR